MKLTEFLNLSLQQMQESLPHKKRAEFTAAFEAAEKVEVKNLIKAQNEYYKRVYVKSRKLKELLDAHDKEEDREYRELTDPAGMGTNFNFAEHYLKLEEFYKRHEPARDKLRDAYMQQLELDAAEDKFDFSPYMVVSMQVYIDALASVGK